MERNYIYELLQKHSRVIIPNFGAFLIKDKAKISNADSGQNITISFNDFLKFNDGVLIDYIAQKQKINKLQAGNIVNDFIQEINSQLKDKGFYIIDGVGKLFTDDKAVIRFSQEIGKTGYGDNKKDVSKPKKSTVISSSAEGVLPKEEVSVKAEDKKEPRPVVEKKKEEKVFTKAEAPVRHEVEIGNKDSKSSKGKWIFSILLFVILVITALYLAGFFNGNRLSDSANNKAVNHDKSVNLNNSPETNTPAGIAKNINSELTEKDTLVEDTEQRESSSENIVEDSDSIVNSNENKSEIIEKAVPKPFHLIAASCNSKKVADKYVAKLKAQGYESKIINEKNGHFRVSYGSYETKEAALKELENLKSKKKSAWYLYYPMD